jgi:outer membrane biosynthesis protein TonB
LQPPARAAHPDKPIRLQIVRQEKPPEPPEPPEPPKPLARATPPPHRRRIVDNSDMPEATRPPPGTMAEGDKNTAASSEIAPNGDRALPAQAGRAIPALNFDTRRFVAAASPAHPQPAATPVVETAPPLPQPDAQARRTPPAGTPSQPPAPTPDEFGFVEPTPTPKPPDFDPFVRAPASDPAAPTPAVVAAARPPRSMRSEEKTQIRGGLSNRGVSSVAATASPEGRYTKAVSDAIRVLWYARINNQMDLASFGTVTIHFSLDRRGKVIAPYVVSNSGNDALASISLQAVMDAKIPAMPPEVAAAIERPDLPLDFDFSLY